jgi:hypothetical protein
VTECRKQTLVSSSQNEYLFSSYFLLIGTFTISEFIWYVISEDVYLVIFGIVTKPPALYFEAEFTI